MVNDISDRSNRLDVLINNAGVYKPERNITQEGLEEIVRLALIEIREITEY